MSVVKANPSDKVPAGTARSVHWPAARTAWLKDNPTCRVCGAHDNVEVHHKVPFHISPSLELNPSNFITLCESKSVAGINCHLLFGHLGNFKSYNANVEHDAGDWSTKLSTRPSV